MVGYRRVVKLITVLVFAALAVSAIFAIPASAESESYWILIISVKRIKLLEPVDPWPGHEHGEIYIKYWIATGTIIGEYNLPTEIPKTPFTPKYEREYETPYKSLKVGKIYTYGLDIYEASFYVPCGDFPELNVYTGGTCNSVLINVKIYDEDLWIRGYSDDLLGEYPSSNDPYIKYPIRVFEFIKVTKLVPGEDSSFTILTDKIFAEFEVTWERVDP